MSVYFVTQYGPRCVPGRRGREEGEARIMTENTQRGKKRNTYCLWVCQGRLDIICSYIFPPHERDTAWEAGNEGEILLSIGVSVRGENEEGRNGKKN